MTTAAAAKNQSGVAQRMDGVVRRGDTSVVPPHSHLRHTALRDNDESEDEESIRTENEDDSDELGNVTFSGPNKRGNENQDKADEEANIQAQYENQLHSKKKAKRTPRPTLTAEHLTDSSNGLVRVATEFPRLLQQKARRLLQCHRHSEAPPSSSAIAFAASYSSALMTAYEEWGKELLPQQQQHPLDVLLKIEQLGSKATVKNYLQRERHEVCRRYLETALGRSKAEELVQQLQDYTNSSSSSSHISSSDNPGEEHAHEPNISAHEPEEEEVEATFDDDAVTTSVANPTTTTTTNATTSTDYDDMAALEAQVAAAVTAQKQRRQRRIAEDSDDDDDGEAEFGDDNDQAAVLSATNAVGHQDKVTQNSGGAKANHFSSC